MTPPDDHSAAVTLAERPAGTRLSIIDCDVHHALRSTAGAG